MFFRLFVYNIEQFPVTLLKDGDYEALRSFNCEDAVPVLYNHVECLIFPLLCHFNSDHKAAVSSFHG